MIDEREERIYEICEQDARFKAQAFFLIYSALGRARVMLQRDGHIAGQDLLRALSEEARSQYGPMTLAVLQHMGLRNTRDVGDLVFVMVREGLLSKTEGDTAEDFENGYDFEEEFVRDYEW